MRAREKAAARIGVPYALAYKGPAFSRVDATGPKGMRLAAVVSTGVGSFTPRWT